MMTTPRDSDYEVLGEEYYTDAHQTSANLRAGSSAILSRWIPDAAKQAGTVLDIGAGDSVVAPFLASGPERGQTLLIADRAGSMLAHSRTWRPVGAQLLQCDATRLPLSSGSIGLVVSSLGDPYNVVEFWREVARVLQRGGSVMFTAPSPEWAYEYRRAMLQDVQVAEFLCRRGVVRVPSHVRTREEQLNMALDAGLSIREVTCFMLRELGAVRVSEKLSSVISPNTPIVDAYWWMRSD